MPTSSYDRLSQSLRRVPEKFLSSKVDDELILIQGDSGAFYSLKDVGLDIWDQIETPKQLHDVARDLSNSYEVDHDECQAAVLKFADDLVRAGLAEYA